MTDKMPDYAIAVIKKINEAGYEAYAVGGCVRDCLMGITPYDWDITTNATAMQIKSVFKDTRDTGIEHGTVTVLEGSGKCEVTTYRIESSYSDYRRPDCVVFTDNLKKDLERRDFTINAIAFHPDRGIIDLFSGISDIERKIIKTVENPSDRFNEDALRMLRAVRFKAQLGFELEESTKQAIIENARLVSHISLPRIRGEVDKVIMSQKPDFFIEFFELGLMKHMLPSLDELHSTCKKNDMTDLQCKQNTQNAFNQNNKIKDYYTALKCTPNELEVRWASLMCIYASGCSASFDQITIILTKAGFGAGNTKKITAIIEYVFSKLPIGNTEIRFALSKAGVECLKNALLIKAAFVKNKKSELNKIQIILKIIEEIVNQKYPLRIEDLPIDGNDLINLGVQQGKVIGEILDSILKKVLTDPSLNDKEKLISLAKLHITKL